MTNAKLFLFLSIALLAALPWRAVADESVDLIWDASSSPDVVGYNIRYGTTSGNYTEIVPAGNVANAKISGLVEGQTYYFVVTDYDWNGIESLPSNEFAYTVPAIDPPDNLSIVTDASIGETVLTWSPSPDPNVEGYNVYWTVNGSIEYYSYSCGNATEFVLPNYFDYNPGTVLGLVVTAYDYTGESIASQEITYTIPSQASPNATLAVSAPVLSLQQLPANGLTGVFSVTATGTVPANWTLQASSDLQTWNTLTTGTDPAVNVTVVVSATSQLFFQVNSESSPYVPMPIQTLADAFPNSFCAITDTALPDWNVQFSEDSQTWTPLTSGSGTAVNVAVVTTGAPSLFFRLAGQ